jgi:tripartite-type tricarboxylate transporter receptor subunit TctC
MEHDDPDANGAKIRRMIKQEKKSMSHGFSASRSLALVAAAMTFALVAAASLAQSNYPNRPIRVLTPFSAGGGSDILARLIGPQITEAWGQPVIVDNRPGGGGTLGAGIAARAEPDGYTLIVVSGTYGANAALYKVPYDTVDGISPIILIGTTPLVMLVHPSLPVKTVAELIKYATANPDKLSFGSAGVGDLGHLAGELFKQHAKIRMTQVPYKGSGPLMTAIVSGEVPMSINSMVPAMPHVKAGRIRPLAVTTQQRSRALPDTPALAETVPGYEVIHWYGMWGPKGLPQEIVTRWNREVARILKTDAMQKFFEREGMEPAGGPPQEFRDRIRKDLEKWKRVVKEAKIIVHD